MAYTTRELSARTFRDFAALAVQQGECWCIFYQRPRPVGRRLSAGQRSALNRKDKEGLVRERRSHAVLVYDGKTPIGWCQYGRREELPRIDARRTYREAAAPDNTETLWRITCFFVARSHRGRESRSSRCTPHSIQSGDREAGPSRRFPWCRRRWPRSRNGDGSAPWACFDGKLSRPSLR